MLPTSFSFNSPNFMQFKPLVVLVYYISLLAAHLLGIMKEPTKQNSKEFSLSDFIVRHKSITKGNLQMLASNDNQLTLHVKIIFREYSQISTSYYTSLSEKFRKKKNHKTCTIIYIQIKNSTSIYTRHAKVNRRPY